jgi:DNA modification methylase
MTPYYQHGGITIYHGDCRVILPQITDRFDLLLTDPPYGIGESSKKNATRGKPFGGKPQGKNTRGTAIPPRDYGEYSWDADPVEEWVMFLARRLCKWQIIFGGNYYELPPSSCWLVWDKENSGDFADGEMAWTNLQKAMRIKRHMWNGMLRKGNEERFHPTQKPLGVMLWALEQAPEDVATVLDPWMGSGTTLRACKDTGRQCVGIEREEHYCEIAAMRLQQEVFSL